MLTTRSLRPREWALFVLVALLPALAMGLLGLRALRNEEVAIGRQMQSQLEQTAAEQRESYAATLTNLEVDPSASAPFAEPVQVAADAVGSDDDRATAGARITALGSCRSQADKLRAAGKEREKARRYLLDSCADARSESGRMLWPLVALDPEVHADAAALGAWIAKHGSALGAAERAVVGEELAAASWLEETQRRELGEALLHSLGEGSARSHLAARSLAMRAGKAEIRWREAASIGLLRRQDDGGYRGFVVHPGSVRRALAQGWPTLPPDMMARLDLSATDTPVKSSAAAVELFPGGARLLLDWRDPRAVARQAQRSRLVLIAVAAAAALLAAGLAALLFARMRAERRLSALRTDFVAAVSHELRTPIASIRMLAELLAEDRVEEDERDEMQHALAREAARLGGTVERLLGFSRMEAGKQVARLERRALAPLVADAIDTFEERHPEAGRIGRNLDESIELPLDAAALTMALDNLLSNALKYAPDGRPYEVAVASERGGARISVSDHGAGIARRDRERIFQPFERADDRLSQATEGSGIGLSLVRHVARAHGGRAEVASEPGKGATFSLWLPHARDNGGSHDPAKSDRPQEEEQQQA